MNDLHHNISLNDDFLNPVIGSRVVLSGASYGWDGVVFEFEHGLVEDAANKSALILVFVLEDNIFVYTDAMFNLVSVTTAGHLPVQTLVIGLVANAYHKLLQEINNVNNTIVNAMCAFSKSGIGGIVRDKAWILADNINTPISYVHIFSPASMDHKIPQFSVVITYNQNIYFVYFGTYYHSNIQSHFLFYCADHVRNVCTLFQIHSYYLLSYTMYTIAYIYRLAVIL